MALSHEQLRALTIVERCASTLSILGVVAIIGLFSFSRHFRNPIQRIIFINAFYNLFDFIATMISLSGPDAGNNSALCQFQAFCLQMCVQNLATLLLKSNTILTRIAGFHWQMYSGHLPRPSMSSWWYSINMMLKLCASLRRCILVSSLLLYLFLLWYSSLSTPQSEGPCIAA